VCVCVCVCDVFVSCNIGLRKLILVAFLLVPGFLYAFDFEVPLNWAPLERVKFATLKQDSDPNKELVWSVVTLLPGTLLYKGLPVKCDANFKDNTHEQIIGKSAWYSNYDIAKMYFNQARSKGDASISRFKVIKPIELLVFIDPDNIEQIYDELKPLVDQEFAKKERKEDNNFEEMLGKLFALQAATGFQANTLQQVGALNHHTFNRWEGEHKTVSFDAFYFLPLKSPDGEVKKFKINLGTGIDAINRISQTESDNILIDVMKDFSPSFAEGFWGMGVLNFKVKDKVFESHHAEILIYSTRLGKIDYDGCWSEAFDAEPSRNNPDQNQNNKQYQEQEHKE